MSKQDVLDAIKAKRAVLHKRFNATVAEDELLNWFEDMIKRLKTTKQ